MGHSVEDSQKRAQRLRIFVRMLKKGQYPNYKTLRAAIEKEPHGDPDFTRQTLIRDVKYLKDRGARIKFDHVNQNGYELMDLNWNGFTAFMGEDEMRAAVLGAQFVESILPPSPLRDKIRESVDFLWAGNHMSSEEAFAQWNSLVIQGLPVKIIPDVFQTIYQQWCSQHTVEITHTSASTGRKSTCVIEPHILAYTNGTWYVRGKSRTPGKRNPDHKDFLTFALHRITSATPKGELFENGLDYQEIEAVNQGRIFDFPKFKDVRLKANGMSLRQALETLPVKETNYSKPDCAELLLDEIEEFKVINFVLVAGGDAEILAPQELRKKAKEKADAIAKRNA